MLGQLSGHWWAFMLLGILAGTISGMLGLGAGVVVVPTLVLLFAFPQKSAQGTALALMVSMALLGAFRYWRNPQIEVSLAIVGLLALGAVPGVLAGTELAARLPSYWLRKFFAVFLAIMAVKMFTASPKRGPEIPGESLVNQTEVRIQETGDRIQETSDEIRDTIANRKSQIENTVEPGGQSNESTEQ